MTLHNSPPRNKLPASAGIAIGPILFIIAVLGILASAISAGSGSFSSNTSGESTKAMASTVLEYAQQVDWGTNLVLGQGYEENQISFELPAGKLTNWQGTDWSPQTVNGNCLSNTCKVYASTGGGVVPRALPPGVFDTSKVLNGFFNCSLAESYEACVVGWVHQMGVKGMGGSANGIPQLGLVLFNLNEDVCAKVNDLLGITNPSGTPPAINEGIKAFGAPFAGSFDFSPLPAEILGASTAEIEGKKSFCYRDQTSGGALSDYGHIFVHILVPR